MVDIPYSRLTNLRTFSLFWRPSDLLAVQPLAHSPYFPTRFNLLIISLSVKVRPLAEHSFAISEYTELDGVRRSIIFWMESVLIAVCATSRFACRRRSQCAD